MEEKKHKLALTKAELLTLIKENKFEAILEAFPVDMKKENYGILKDKVIGHGFGGPYTYNNISRSSEKIDYKTLELDDKTIVLAWKESYSAYMNFGGGVATEQCTDGLIINTSSMTATAFPPTSFVTVRTHLLQPNGCAYATQPYDRMELYSAPLTLEWDAAKKQLNTFWRCADGGKGNCQTIDIPASSTPNNELIRLAAKAREARGR